MLDTMKSVLGYVAPDSIDDYCNELVGLDPVACREELRQMLLSMVNSAISKRAAAAIQSNDSNTMLDALSFIIQLTKPHLVDELRENVFVLNPKLRHETLRKHLRTFI